MITHDLCIYVFIYVFLSKILNKILKITFNQFIEKSVVTAILLAQ